MERYEATFRIRSPTDARAARLLVERAYDAFREEVKETGRGDHGPNETLQQLDALREALREPSIGTLLVTYERSDEAFDD